MLRKGETIMKKSKYNIEHLYKNSLIMYNTLSGSVIRLDAPHSRMYNNPNAWSTDENFILNMKRGNFIVPDEVDELNLILNTSNNSRKKSNIGAYTIAPTLECNFRCPYCFEPSHKRNIMTDETANAVVEYIKKDIDDNNYEGVEITWYGGEPLLALPVIETISMAVMNFTKKYAANIVTNGFYLNRETSERLKQLNVKSAQITIDGPPEVHNKRRRLPSGEDTFYKILNNIIEANDLIDIIIRINVDKSNIAEIDRLIDIFDSYNLRNRISVYLAAVENINGTYSSPELCMENISFSELEVKFAREHNGKGYFRPFLPGFNPSICGAVCDWAKVFDSKGNLYKCWNEIGNLTKSYDSIFSTEKRNSSVWSNYSLDNFADCLECIFLPLCMGGCPYERLQGKKNNCISIKENCESMLELLAENFTK